MDKLLIATHNKGKIKEFSAFLEHVPFHVLSLSDVGIENDVEEDGKTYEENSQKKAIFYAKISGLPSLSDDGGLEISALDNAPGVRSRRWLGYEASDDELIAQMEKIAKELPDTNRKARFVTVVSFAMPDGNVWSRRGEVTGVIAKKPFLKMNAGYPYRSFFYLPDIQKYYHESDLSASEMETYNHRKIAVQNILPVIASHISP